MKQVIIVEDDVAIQDTLTITLSEEDIKVTCFPAGEDIINGNYETPDLFILDKQLSGVSGLEVCEWLKSRTETKHIPVIMISASPSIVQLGTVAGADDVIVKPFRIADIRKVVNKHIQS